MERKKKKLQKLEELQCAVHPFGSLANYKYVVVFARYNSQWAWSRGLPDTDKLTLTYPLVTPKLWNEANGVFDNQALSKTDNA